MILAVMSLEQWMEMHTDESEGIRRLNYTSWRTALDQLQMTDIRLLLLASGQSLVKKYEHFVNTIASRLGEADELLMLRNADEGYMEALRAVFRALPDRDTKPVSALQIKMLESTDTIVSFTDSLKQNDEFSNLSFYNPGSNFEHYHAWVASYVPIFPSQNTIVLSLGDVIKQEKIKIISLLKPIVLRQLPDADLAMIMSKVNQLISEQEIGRDGYIYQLKMSFLEESLFDEKMITLIQERIGLYLSSEEFNQIWQSTNPSFDQFKPQLDRVDARAIRREQYGLACISLTNVKDMRHLLDELRRHDHAYETMNDQLIGFAGIPLTCSYIEQKTRVEMLRDIVRKVSAGPSFLSARHPIMHTVYFVTCETNLSKDLTAIGQIPGVILLLGWDGSPIQKWVNEQLALENNVTSHQCVGSMG